MNGNVIDAKVKPPDVPSVAERFQVEPCIHYSSEHGVTFQPHQYPMPFSGSIQILMAKLGYLLIENFFGFLSDTISSSTNWWKYCECQTLRLRWKYTKSWAIYIIYIVRKRWKVSGLICSQYSMKE